MPSINLERLREHLEDLQNKTSNSGSPILTARQKRKRLKIKVNCNRQLLEKTLTELFKHGYVMGEQRIRTIEALYAQFGKTNSSEWDWLTTGDDDECSMVLGALSHWSWSSELREYETVNDVLELLFLNEDITQEEFLIGVEKRDEAKRIADEERRKKDEELALKRKAREDNRQTADDVTKIQSLYNKWKYCSATYKANYYSNYYSYDYDDGTAS